MVGLRRQGCGWSVVGTGGWDSNDGFAVACGIDAPTAQPRNHPAGVDPPRIVFPPPKCRTHPL